MPGIEYDVPLPDPELIAFQADGDQAIEVARCRPLREGGVLTGTWSPCPAMNAVGLAAQPGGPALAMFPLNPTGPGDTVSINLRGEGDVLRCRLS